MTSRIESRKSSRPPRKKVRYVRMSDNESEADRKASEARQLELMESRCRSKGWVLGGGKDLH